MKRLVPAWAASLMLVGCTSAPREPQVTVENAVVTVPAVPGGPGAAYFTATTNNDPTALVSIASPSVRTIELHETREQGGRSGMVPLERGGTTFDPGEPLRLAPGGKHAMLIGMDPAIRPGGKMQLILRFDPLREPVTVEADVRGPGQAHMAH